MQIIRIIENFETPKISNTSENNLFKITIVSQVVENSENK